jgi:hypothetical protein
MPLLPQFVCRAALSRACSEVRDRPYLPSLIKDQSHLRHYCLKQLIKKEHYQ